LNFTSISAAIASKSSLTAANEALSLLRIIREFVCNLDNEHKENANVTGYLGFNNSINLLDSYYTLNDIFLGLTIGDKENEKEKGFLGELLASLSDALGFKVEQEALRASFERFNDENALESIIEDTREILKKPIQKLKA